MNSVNDAPIAGTISDKNVDEDSGDISVPLDATFTDEDLLDSDPSDEELTYTITIIDKPNRVRPDRCHRREQSDWCDDHEQFASCGAANDRVHDDRLERCAAACRGCPWRGGRDRPRD
ncbi:MAG: hypothetical protein U5O39_04290 [Gammaproteobacteria bacterium]|nr:hypothetical protein [Gammaproteobacteria bacterium]